MARLKPSPMLPLRLVMTKENHHARIVHRRGTRVRRFQRPALPPGLTAEKIHAGIDLAMSGMKARGWDAQLRLVQPDASARATVARTLSDQDFDCVVIGGGIRIPSRSLLLFESLVNAIHRTAPDAAIAFNTSPENTATAAARWLG
jgi:hypothetical protein